MLSALYLYSLIHQQLLLNFKLAIQCVIFKIHAHFLHFMVFVGETGESILAYCIGIVSLFGCRY
jgi:hypothetical protein